MKNEKKNSLKAGMLLTMFAVAFVAGIMMLSSVTDVVEHHIYVERKMVLVTGDGDPGDNSGFFYFMIYPHQADPGTAYASNLSNATAYEYSDSINTSATGETPYSTAFDIVIKVGCTDEDGYNTTSSAWDDSYMSMTLTCADLSIGGDTSMTEIQIVNHSSYRWMHYYLNNGGSGYTINEGESFNITSAKYYVNRIV